MGATNHSETTKEARRNQVPPQFRKAVKNAGAKKVKCGTVVLSRIYFGDEHVVVHEDEIERLVDAHPDATGWSAVYDGRGLCIDLYDT